jgi:hypothetical protein
MDRLIEMQTNAYSKDALDGLGRVEGATEQILSSLLPPRHPPRAETSQLTSISQS